MKTTIKNELGEYLLDLINNGVINDDNIEDIHFEAFNRDYYVIGYWVASEWLKKHRIDPFEGINICNEYELENFGETSNKYQDPEKVVNMLVYIFGAELISSLDFETVNELEIELNNL